MKDKDKTQGRLIKELTSLRQRIAELEALKRKRNQFEEALRAEKDKAQQYLDIAEVILVALNKKGEITLINKKGNHILGYKEGELLGKNWFTICVPSRLRKKIKNAFLKLMAGDVTLTEFYENPVLTKSGTERMMAWHNALLQDTQGNPIGTLSSGEDITDRKRAEEALKESEKKYRQVVENATDIIYTTDINGNFTYANSIALKVTGYSLEELQRFNYLDLVVPEYRDQLKEIYVNQFRARQETTYVEFPFSNKFGKVMWFGQNASLMFEGGKIIGFQIIARDITERKRAEEALRESEERFRLAFENANTGVCLVDLEGNLTQVNDKMCEIFGYTQEELEVMTVNDIAHPEDVDLSPEFIQKTLRGKINRATFEKRYIHKKGHVVTCQVSNSLVRDANGMPLYFISHLQDITDRKQAEENLRESEERYKTLFDEALAGICLADAETGIIIDCNQALATLVGRERADLIGKPQNILHPPVGDEKAAFSPTFKQHLTDKEGQILETQVVTKTGEIREVEIKANLLNLRGRKALQGLFHDITDRKHAVEELRDSRHMLQTVLDAIPSAVFWKDRDSRYLGGNRAWLEATGLKSSEEVAGKSDYDLPWTKEQADAFREDDRRVMELGIPESGIIEPYFRADGTHAWAMTNKVPLQDTKGNVIGVLGTFEDITARKRAEEALRDSEEKYRDLVENINDIIYATDESGRITYISPRIESIGGYTVSEIIGRPFSDFVYQEDLPEVLEKFQELIAGNLEPSEYRMVTKTGDVRWVRTSSRPFFEDDRIVGLRGVLTDITERKQAEEALQRSYDQLQETFISAINALASTVEMKDQYTAGHQPRVTQLACAIAEEMGLSEEQIEGLRMAGLIHDIGKIVVPAEILNKPGSLTEVQYEMIKMHPQAGHDILKRIAFPWPVARIVLQHHEMMDGSGYPQGLSGEGILPEARILAVANCVEAMSSHRPYRPAYDIKETLAEISQNRGVKYDPAAVDACLRLFTKKGFIFDPTLH